MLGNSKKTVIILISVITLLLVVGVSYAYIRLTTVQEDLNILSTIDCLSATIADKNSSINLTGAYPVPDEEGLTGTPYIFTVTNDCKNNINVDINLEVLPVSTIADKHIKVALDNNFNSLIRYEKVSSNIVGSTSYKLKENVHFISKETKTFNLRLWLDEHTTTQQGANKVFESKIVIITTPSEETLAGKILAQAGGAEAIEAKGEPDFSVISPAVINYEEVTETYTSSMSSSANKLIGTGYTFNETTGRYTLTGYVTNQTYGPEHIGQYTCNLSSTYSNCSTMYKILEVNDTKTTKSISYSRSVKTLDDSDTGLYAAEDDDGTSYYYRGNKEILNNNLIFAGFQWKIIRINGDGSVRIMYNGTEAEFNSSKTMNSMGLNTQSAKTSWNLTHRDDSKYMGYMYGGANGVASTQRHGLISAAATFNQTSTNAKTILDNWYKINIFDKGHSNLVVDNLFCNDRQLQSEVGGSSTGPGFGIGESTYYAPNYRLSTNRKPFLKCGMQNDRFTVNNTSLGNGALTYPVGLLSADEAAVAGLVYDVENLHNYLVTEETYWSMSPQRISTTGITDIFKVRADGRLNTSSYTSVIASSGLRPVISLSYSTTVIGSGTSTDPFKVI